jgi:putative spermidine/putrescine transport system substrate-binding protein
MCSERFPAFERDPIALLVAGLAFVLAAGCGAESAGPAATTALERPWEEIVERARGQTVTWGMWMGDPFINRYVEDFVRPALRERYGVELDLVSAQGRDILAMQMTEMEAGAPVSQIDLMWINGENFHQLRRIGALLGPLDETLPNARFVDFDDPFIRYDFQQEIDGYECPWGTVQFALIHDAARVAHPPRTPEALAEWVRDNPGRFTIENGFTGMTFLKSLLIHFAGGPGSLDGAFDEARYERAAEKLWAYLRELQPHLWRSGETFPEQLSQVHQLFAAGELDFTMSNNDGEVDNKVLQGLFPDTARAFVLDTGTIRNTHYLGIASRSRHVEGALVAIDFLIAPEAQYEKLKPAVWGDGTVLDVERLPAPWPERFADVPKRERAPRRKEIRPLALREPDPQTMIRLYEDFRSEIIEGGGE